MLVAVLHIDWWYISQYQIFGHRSLAKVEVYISYGRWSQMGNSKVVVGYSKQSFIQTHQWGVTAIASIGMRPVAN